MRSLRIYLTFVLVAAISACSSLSPLPLGPTATPSATLTPTVTPTFTPSPTPIPAIRIESGDRAFFNGDYDAARAEYQQAFAQSTDADTRAESLWGLARTEFEAGDLDAANAFLEQLIREHPDHLRAAQAHFLLGESYGKLNRFAEAAAQYGAYLSARINVIDAYALERQGDAYFSAANYVEALASFNAAAQAPRRDVGLELQIKIGQTRAALGDYAGALTQYDAIALSGNDFVKAQMDYLAGSAHKFLGETDKSQARFLHAVENYPVSYYSYLSLVELVDAGVAVNDLDRGIVDYFAGQYDVAIVALDRAIVNGLGADGTARYYRALSLVKAGRHSEGAAEFRFFIDNFSAHPKWAIAWYGDLNYPTITPGLAFTQWYHLSQHTQAAQTLREFASTAIANSLTMDYLMLAARILERDNQLNDAAVLWESVADQFAGDTRAKDSAFLAGITFYRLGDQARALSNFERSLTLATDTDSRARAYLWIGKTHKKLGDTVKAQEAWIQAQNLDATTYYSVRSRDLLTGRAIFEPASLADLDVDLASERVAAADWMRLRFSLPADTDLSGPGALASDPRFVRGTEFWRLGLYDEARLEFEDLRELVSSNPADSFRLANYLLDLGLYRSGVTAIRQVLTLAGYDEHSASLQVADYFNHVRFGLYFRELIEPAAQLNQFDALFLFSVMRQESLYEGFVRSSAGARGLMQIIPETGSDVASRMGWPLSFEPDMLYRPIVSVKLGTYYLASNRVYLNGDLYGALAAYNAGPGNALAWQGLAGDDPDLFLEVVRPEETRNYIRGIYEIYNIYRTLYSPVQ